MWQSVENGGSGLPRRVVACPPHFAPRILTANKMLSGGTPFLLAELSARLVLSAEADAIRSRVKAEIEARAGMARASLGGYEFTSHKHAPFIWLKLPEPWLSGTFKNAAAREGVLIDDEDEYKCGRTDRAFHRARIGFSAPAMREEVADGFATLRSLLDNGWPDTTATADPVGAAAATALKRARTHQVDARR